MVAAMISALTVPPTEDDVARAAAQISEGALADVTVARWPRDKNGKPVAELRPPTSPRPKSPFGLHKGMIEISGDIVSPIDVKWDASR